MATLPILVQQNILPFHFVFNQPIGYEPIPKSQYSRSSNGCGTYDFIFDDSPESLIHVEKEFISCCNDHDECYE